MYLCKSAVVIIRIVQRKVDPMEGCLTCDAMVGKTQPLTDAHTCLLFVWSAPQIPEKPGAIFHTSYQARSPSSRLRTPRVTDSSGLRQRLIAVNLQHTHNANGQRFARQLMINLYGRTVRCLNEGWSRKPDGRPIDVWRACMPVSLYINSGV